MTQRQANGEREVGGFVAPTSVGQKDENDDLDEIDIGVLIRFFKLLNKWDREGTRNAESM